VPFHHRWIRARRATDKRFDFEQFALATLAARAGRFAFPSSDPRSPLANLGYAYHFDASLYARFLRTMSEARACSASKGG